MYSVLKRLLEKTSENFLSYGKWYYVSLSDFLPLKTREISNYILSDRAWFKYLTQPLNPLNLTIEWTTEYIYVQPCFDISFQIKINSKINNEVQKAKIFHWRL